MNSCFQAIEQPMLDLVEQVRLYIDLNPLLQRGDDSRQEGIGLKRIEGAVIDGERQVTHGAHADRFQAFLFHHAYAALELADAQNGHLRLIDDDGSRQQAAAHPVIGNRECAAANILRRQLASPGRRNQLAQLQRHAEKIQLLRAVDHRHDQSAAPQGRADADIAVRVQGQCILLEACIHFRVRAQGPRAGRDKIRGERQARALPLELGGVAIAVRQDAGQIRLEQRSHVRRDGNAASHVFGDAPAHGGVRHARFLRLLPPVPGNILRGDAAVSAAAVNLGGGQRVFLEEPAHRGAQRPVRVVLIRHGRGSGTGGNRRDRRRD